jgi:hypothetical protein
LKDIKVNTQFLSPIGASAAPVDGWDPARAIAIVTRLHGVGKATPPEKLNAIAMQEGWLCAGSEPVKNGSVSEANLAICFHKEMPNAERIERRVQARWHRPRTLGHSGAVERGTGLIHHSA